MIQCFISKILHQKYIGKSNISLENNTQNIDKESNKLYINKTCEVTYISNDVLQFFRSFILSSTYILAFLVNSGVVYCQN